MDQNTVNSDFILGGIYAVYFFIFYLLGRKAAPKRVLRFSLGCWVGLVTIMLFVSGLLSMALFLFLFVVSLIVFPSKVDNSLQLFFSANHIYKATSAPRQVAELLGSRYYSCAEGTLKTALGEDVPFNWWQGLESSMTTAGKSTVTTFTHFLAVSFAPNVISEQFKQIARAKADTSGFAFRKRFKHWFVLDTDTPILVKEIPDGSFVIVWQTYQHVQEYTKYLNWLKESLLSISVPVSGDPISSLSSEPTSCQRVIPASLGHPQQALGIAPKTHSLNRY